MDLGGGDSGSGHGACSGRAWYSHCRGHRRPEDENLHSHLRPTSTSGLLKWSDKWRMTPTPVGSRSMTRMSTAPNTMWQCPAASVEVERRKVVDPARDRVGVVLQEVDRPRRRAGGRQRHEAADGKADHEVDRQDDRKGVGVHVGVRHRVERPGDARVEGGDPEGERLGQGSHPRMSPPLRCRESPGAHGRTSHGRGTRPRRDAPGQVVEPFVRRRVEAERRLDEVQDLAGRPTQKPSNFFGSCGNDTATPNVIMTAEVETRQPWSRQRARL